jgi:hypothetical protein
MKLFLIAYLALITLQLETSPMPATKRKLPTTNEAKVMFAENMYIAKGGIGIVRKTDLYIHLHSASNELFLSGGRTWSGRSARTVEIVIFDGSKIISPEALPQDFDMSNAVIISFERDKVRFFDFKKLSGGYYRREAPE